MRRSQRQQGEREVAVFVHFADVANLPIEPGSIEKRLPPEPDIRCRLQNGSSLAFELVEICNPRNARFMFSAQRKHNLIMAAYESLEPEIRAIFYDRYKMTPLSFVFRSGATLSQIRNVLPDLLVELVLSEAKEEHVNFSERVSCVVAMVREAGRPIDPDGVNFNIGGYYDPTVPLDAVTEKLSKTYRTDAPIELLAHFGSNAWGQDRDYREAFLDLLRARGTGSFRRVWILDWRGIGLVFPADAGDSEDHLT